MFRIILRAIERVLQKIEEVRAPLWQWCAGFVGILFIRFFLENFSSPTPSFPATPDAATLVHYFLFFAGTFIALSLALRIFVPDISRISKFLFFGFPIIWLSPILDLIYSHGAGYPMAYIFAGNTGDLIRAFFHLGLGGPATFGGITPGLKTELITIIIGACFYTGIRTKSAARAVFAGITSYLVLFFWIAIPGILALAMGGQQPSSSSTMAYLVSLFGNSHMIQNFVRPTTGLSYLYEIELAFNGGMSVIFYLLDFFLVALWAMLYRPRAIVAFTKNIRPGRLVYYLGMIVIGTLAVIRTEPAAIFANWVDGALFLCLIVTYFCAFMFAVGVNDLADEKIDAISNGDRPLPSGALQESDFSNNNVFLLGWSLIGGFICGYWAFFTVCVFTAAYYIYSAPPLRLKRIPLLSSFLISLTTLSALTAGFYFADANKFVSDFPMWAVALIIVCITLGVNFKDIKDIAGDRADGVWTIPVLFGEERGKQIVGALLAMGFLAVPIILKTPSLFWPSLAAAVLGYCFSVMKSYREWRIFALYFTYAGTVGLLLWLHPLPL